MKASGASLGEIAAGGLTAFMCVWIFLSSYKASILGHTIKYSCLPSSGNLKSDARV